MSLYCGLVHRNGDFHQSSKRGSIGSNRVFIQTRWLPPRSDAVSRVYRGVTTLGFIRYWKPPPRHSDFSQSLSVLPFVADVKACNLFNRSTSSWISLVGSINGDLVGDSSARHPCCPCSYHLQFEKMTVSRSRTTAWSHVTALY